MQTIDIHGDLHVTGCVTVGHPNGLPVRIVVRGGTLRQSCHERPSRGTFIDGSLTTQGDIIITSADGNGGGGSW